MQTDSSRVAAFINQHQPPPDSARVPSGGFRRVFGGKRVRGWVIREYESASSGLDGVRPEALTGATEDQIDKLDWEKPARAGLFLGEDGVFWTLGRDRALDPIQDQTAVVFSGEVA